MKVTLVVFLVGALAVNPTHSCKPADTVSFFKELNENYQLVERAKAAAGKQSSSKVSCFNTLSLDTALFSADVFTDVANGINLYYGPDPNTTVNETEGGINDGRIRKAHPVWGVMMITIPFLPMMVVAFFYAIHNGRTVWVVHDTRSSASRNPSLLTFHRSGHPRICPLCYWSWYLSRDKTKESE